MEGLEQIIASKSATQLRARLRRANPTLSSAFVRLDGLAVEPADLHGAMLQYLRRAGCGNALEHAPPQVVALDWSCADRCSAEGLAFFGVLSRLIRSQRSALIVCLPASADLADIVAESHVREMYPDVVWVATPTSGLKQTAIAAPFLALQSPIVGEAALPFVSAIEALLDRSALNPNVIDLATSLLMELLQNISTHAKGAFASAIAITHTRRRPAVLEIGLADTGAGLPQTVLAGPRLRWLVPLCDASILEAFVANGVTRRALEDGGGALREVVLRFLSGVSGSAILIRSGSALIRIDPTLPRFLRATQLSYGFGTQIRLQIPLVGT